MFATVVLMAICQQFEMANNPVISLLVGWAIGHFAWSVVLTGIVLFSARGNLLR